jgi:hypothetical protein
LVKSPHNTEIINHQREIPVNSRENNMPPIFVVVKSGSTFLAEERKKGPGPGGLGFCSPWRPAAGQRGSARRAPSVLCDLRTPRLYIILDIPRAQSLRAFQYTKLQHFGSTI